MTNPVDKRFSRRDFWKKTSAGVGGALVSSQMLLGEPSPSGESQIISNYGGPTPPADEIVLFPFDDHSVPLRYRLQVGLLSATNAYKLNTQAVLEKGKPGTADGHHLLFYGSVAQVGDELRMWYVGFSEKNVKERICYAVSKDGLTWEKPTLGLVELAGNKNNNLVDFDNFADSACIVLYEPDEPDPSRRFKLIYEVSPFDVHSAFSPDGLHWKDSPHNPILKHNVIEPGGLTKFNDCYYLSGQGGNVGSKRALVTYLSWDFENWTDAVAVGLRRDVPPHPRVAGPHAGEQIHEGAALWNRGNVLLGVYGQWHGESNDLKAVSIDLGFVVSNDAIHFREPIPDFQLVSGYGSFDPGEEDAGIPAAKLDQGQAFANIGDQTLIWYGAWAGGKVFVARWVRDRLGYFEVVKTPKPSPLITEDTHSLVWSELLKDVLKPIPAPADPHFISCPLQVTGPDMRVFINADGLSEESHLTVEILDEKCKPLPGYSGNDCIRITKSGLRQPVTWRAKKSLEKFGHQFRIKVGWGGSRFEDAYVYALYVSR
jgi:hypothetical protein